MKKSVMILSAMCLLPFGIAVAGPNCKTKCAEKAATAVAKTECAKSKCAKAEAVAVATKGKCAKAECEEAAVVSTECNLKCEKSVAKMFVSHDKDKDGKLDKTEFMTLIKAMTAKKPATEAVKTTAAN